MEFSTKRIKYQLLSNYCWVFSAGTAAWPIPGNALLLTRLLFSKTLCASLCLSSLRFELHRAVQLETVSQHGPKDVLTQHPDYGNSKCLRRDPRKRINTK